MRPFASDKSVHSFSGSDFHFGSSSTGYDPNTMAFFRAAGENFRGGASRFLEAGGEFGAGNFKFAADAEIAPFFQEEWSRVFDSKRAGEEDVVAESGMRVEREVR